jgi:hypothetical protein
MRKSSLSGVYLIGRTEAHVRAQQSAHDAITAARNALLELYDLDTH